MLVEMVLQLVDVLLCEYVIEFKLKLRVE